MQPACMQLSESHHGSHMRLRGGSGATWAPLYPPTGPWAVARGLTGIGMVAGGEAIG